MCRIINQIGIMMIVMSMILKEVLVKKKHKVKIIYIIDLNYI